MPPSTKFGFVSVLPVFGYSSSPVVGLGAGGVRLTGGLALRSRLLSGLGLNSPGVATVVGNAPAPGRLGVAMGTKPEGVCLFL